MIKSLNIIFHKRKVGTLILTNDNKIAFQYDEMWIKNGFSISPISLPLTAKIYICQKPYFHGLFGVFNDSFIDSWGELLIKRYLQTINIDYDSLNILEKLSYIGKSGMGALEYIPSHSIQENVKDINLDEIQKNIEKILHNDESDDIERLFKLGGSSSGTRPKILTTYDNKEVIIKFSAHFDPKDMPKKEYEYMSYAKESGINVPYIKLITTKENHYFLIERFDRENKEKLHMISASGLLDVDHNTPSLDYLDLIKLTRLVTRNENDVIEMYRRMVFNVLFENQDDHSKNFAFLYNEDTGLFFLSPAFDITPSTTYFGEHTTSINGKGKEITIFDMLEVAKKANIKKSVAEEIISLVSNIKEKYKKS